MDIDLPDIRQGAGGTVRPCTIVHSGPSRPDRCFHFKVVEGQGRFLHLHLPFDLWFHRRQKSISHPFLVIANKFTVV